MALFEITFSLGRVIGPFTAGLLQAMFQIETTFFIMLVLSLVAMIILGLYMVKHWKDKQYDHQARD
jgi:MFS family permease